MTGGWPSCQPGSSRGRIGPGRMVSCRQWSPPPLPASLPAGLTPPPESHGPRSPAQCGGLVVGTASRPPPCGLAGPPPALPAWHPRNPSPLGRPTQGREGGGAQPAAYAVTRVFCFRMTDRHEGSLEALEDPLPTPQERSRWSPEPPWGRERQRECASQTASSEVETYRDHNQTQAGRETPLPRSLSHKCTFQNEMD